MEAEAPYFCSLIIYSIHTLVVNNISSGRVRLSPRETHLLGCHPSLGERSTQQGSPMIREHWGRRDSAGPISPSLKRSQTQISFLNSEQGGSADGTDPFNPTTCGWHSPVQTPGDAPGNVRRQGRWPHLTSPAREPEAASNPPSAQEQAPVCPHGAGALHPGPLTPRRKRPCARWRPELPSPGVAGMALPCSCFHCKQQALSLICTSV